MTHEMTVLPVARAEALSSHKIASRHLERVAMVYVRQSTAQQLVTRQRGRRWLPTAARLAAVMRGAGALRTCRRARRA